GYRWLQIQVSAKVIVIVVNPWFQGSRWRPLRMKTVAATVLSGLLPVIHTARIYPFAQLSQQASGLAVILGAVFDATYFTESWVPKKFDIWGASH
ncbi:unnamed protein product, partial [Clonostachys solani]